jgi:hypothetical protein
MPDLFGSALIAVGIGALALALVKGPDWGWSSPYVLAAFVVAALGTAGFWLRSTRHPLPVVEPALLRVRAFAWSNVTAVLFSVTFGGALLSVVIWLQSVWGWSALKTGLAVAPGALVVPLFAGVAQRLAHRIGPGALGAFGCLVFGLGGLLLASNVGQRPAYGADFLPGWMVAGVGIGFAFPTIVAAATADLPPARTATRSAIVTMARQIGLAIGVALFIAVVGDPIGFDEVHSAFRHAWWVLAGAALLGALTAFGMTPRHPDSAISAAEGDTLSFRDLP